VTDYTVVGQLVNASNATLVVEGPDGRWVYKPTAGERPLWDFPTGTLAHRERAAYLLSELLGWGVVPRTELREGPFGRGSMQEWVDAEVLAVDVLPPAQVPEGWATVLTGVNEQGTQVALAHAVDDQLARIAVFDILANNADRKGGHILTQSDGSHIGIDHGVTFHVEPKLRTVLWGWVGQPVPEVLLSAIDQAAPRLATSELTELLDQDEIAALQHRTADLLATGVFPEPSDEWPSIPWPVF
jgi:uncharacterized repeat protein (TIGR03843 family)